MFQCDPVPGLGFRRGSYRCVCKEGYYFPETNLPLKYRFFNGSDIEQDYERRAEVRTETLHMKVPI